jgi:predicted small lipoprotein YifL
MNGKHDRRRVAPGLLAAILAGSLLIAACGQRGPLYLPQPPEPPRQPAPAAAPPAAVAPDGSRTDVRRRD